MKIIKNQYKKRREFTLCREPNVSVSVANKVPLGQALLFDGLRVRMHWYGCDGEAGINTVFIKSERIDG